MNGGEMESGIKLILSPPEFYSMDFVWFVPFPVTGSSSSRGSRVGVNGATWRDRNSSGDEYIKESGETGWRETEFACTQFRDHHGDDLAMAWNNSTKQQMHCATSLLSPEWKWSTVMPQNLLDPHIRRLLLCLFLSKRVTRNWLW